ncbi:sigma-54-dependent transcriptional regulator [Planctomycetota bacterium]
MDERTDAAGDEPAVEIMPGRPAPRRVLVVDDEEIICKYLRRSLAQLGYDAAYRLSGQEALKELAKTPYSILLADMKMPGMTGMALLEQARDQFPSVSVVIMTAHGSIEKAVEAMKLGALDFLTKPVQGEELELVIKRVLKQRRLLDELADLRREVAGHYKFENMISQDDAMRDIFERIKRVAATDATVVITGETGTGKELVARALHYNSPRRERPFVAINCGALPDTLLESELFGHEEGAFTGAIGTKPGIFEVADGGTLLFDEIGNISSAMQVKLLRVLETMEYKRVGGVETRTCDVRVVAATHVQLAEAVEGGDFRSDLYYRINVVPIVLPPLRERIGDVPLLVEHFIRRHAPRMNSDVQDISREAMLELFRQKWPGNVRQLEHVIQRALILADGTTILPEHLPLEGADDADDDAFFVNEQLPLEEVKTTLVERLERTYLDRVLRMHDGNIRRTAQHAGLSERSIYEKLKKYQLDRRSYK